MYHIKTLERNTKTRLYHPNRTGLTLIEVMLSILIMTIALLGISSTYVSGRKQLIKQQQYQAAVHLASQKVEEIKAAGYTGVDIGEQEDQPSLYGLSFLRQTTVELTAQPTAQIPLPCKKITVSTQWTGTADDQHEVKLITYVGP